MLYIVKSSLNKQHCKYFNCILKLIIFSNYVQRNNLFVTELLNCLNWENHNSEKNATKLLIIKSYY